MRQIWDGESVKVVRGNGAQRGPGPHFICIGPGNSATTWLSDHLKLQRDIWMPPAQEASYLRTQLRPGTHGLDLTLRWDWWSIVKRLVRNRSLLPWRDNEFYREARALSRRVSQQPDLEGYLRLFSPAHGKLTGDIAPGYANFSQEQIRQYLPVIKGRKVFMIVRDPIQRFWSAMSRYAMYQTFGEVDYGSLQTAQRLFHDPERSLQHFPSLILDRWEAVLGRDEVKVFYFDDVAARPAQAFAEILDFIGSSCRYRLPLVPVRYNRKAKNKRVKPSADASEWVRDAFQEELERCAGRFGSHGETWFRAHRRVADGAATALAGAGAGG